MRGRGADGALDSTLRDQFSLRELTGPDLTESISAESFAHRQDRPDLPRKRPGDR
jgi:hypothetical protein